MRSNVECKLNTLLNEFLSPECKIKDDVYFNTLLSHIRCIQEENASLLFDWILKAVHQWKQSGVPSNSLVVSFFINVLSSLSSNEYYFIRLQDGHIYNTLLEIVNIMDSRTSFSLKLHYVRLFRALSTHEKGLIWLMETDMWEHIIDLNLKCITVYITRETQQGISEFLKNVVKLKEAFSVIVVRKIIAPLIANSAALDLESNQNIEICEEDLFRNLRAPLSLINFILEDILTNVEDCELKILKILIDDFSLTRHISTFLNIAHTSEFLYSIGKILIAVKVCSLVIESEVSESDNILRTSHMILNILNRNLPNLCTDNVLKLSQAGFVYTKMISTKKKQAESILILENQLLCVQLLPLIMMSKIYLDQNSMKTEDYVKLISTLFQIDCKDCIQFLSVWHDNLSKHIETQTAIKSLSYLMSSKKFFDARNAVGICQCFTMIVKILDTDIKEMNIPKIPLHIVTFFTHILDALCVLYTEHDLFADGLERTSLVNILKDILQHPIPSQITVKVLKLLNISIRKCNTANMESISQGMNEFGPLLFLKVKDDSWEVRDSVIELLTTLSLHPSFQNLVIKNDFPNAILNMALYDTESFVRVTALQSLQVMVRDDRYWQHLSQNQNIVNYLVIKFQNETEGTVRKELISLLCTIHSFISKEHYNPKPLYDTMMAASDDLHWEVKIEALKFWDELIKNILQKQGLDNTRPGGEPSCENISKPEIHLRLNTVLKDLSHLGCLKAIVSALQDECDIEVSKEAVKIMQPFIDLIRVNMTSYSTKTECDQDVLDTDNTTSYSNTCTKLNTPDRGEIVVNTNVQNSESGKSEISPSEFIRYIQQDFGCMIDERKRWLNGIDELESLLDDMLKKYDDHDDFGDDINPMDCY